MDWAFNLPTKRLRLALTLLLALALSLGPPAAGSEPPGDYVCPPCGHACLETSYAALGACPICGMALVERRSLERDTAGGHEVHTETQFSFRDVVIPSGEITLEARFYIPSAVAEPMAAAVVNHGSAPTSFDQVSYYVALSLEAGMAVLAYSKRGCGGSTGVFRPFSVAESPEIFAELAADAASALRWVEAQPETDPKRVGFVGGSQAGWISPLAASQEPAAFIISIAGTPLSAGEESFHGELVGDGHEAMRKVATPVADRLLESYDGPRGFDPRSILAALDVDTLWVFGSRDQVIPVRASITELERLRASGNERHFVRLVEGVDHNMNVVETGERYDALALVRTWLAARGILGR
jgi:uncharacterized protein